MRYKTISQAFSVFCLLLLIHSVGIARTPNVIGVTAGGRELKLATPAVRQGGKTLVPIGVLRALGVRAVAGIDRGSRRPIVTITMSRRGTFTAPATIVGNECMVAIEEIASRLHISTKWDRTGNALIILGHIREIGFDGKTLRVVTSIPVRSSLVDTDWTRSIGRIVLDFDGAVFPPTSSELIVKSPASLRISTGILEDGTTRVVAKLAPNAVIDSISRPSPLQTVVSTSGRAKNTSDRKEPQASPPATEKASADRPTITGISYSRIGKRTIEVYVAADMRADYTARTLRHPDRLIVEIPGATLRKPIALLTLDGKIARSVEVENRKGLAVRLVVNLGSEASSDVEWDGDRSRYVLTLQSPRETGGTTSGKTVVIDPGHGGVDPGCLGCPDRMEKIATLGIARQLQKILASMGMRAILTRSSDEYLKLKDRADIGERNSADVFVSIHCNAAEQNSGLAHGTETYYHMGDADSKSLAENLQGAVMESVESQDRGAKPDTDRFDSGMAVLSRSSRHGIPSCLIEVGFLDCTDEAKRICDPVEQRKLADAMARGIKSFFTGKPVTARPTKPKRASKTLRSHADSVNPRQLSTQPRVR
ncbi:MAG: N-acetylmuramoyl-L-alanine amidase [Armatimonadota bacterium]